jgi:hypothetical protein
MVIKPSVIGREDDSEVSTNHSRVNNDQCRSISIDIGNSFTYFAPVHPLYTPCTPAPLEPIILSACVNPNLTLHQPTCVNVSRFFVLQLLG